MRAFCTVSAPLEGCAPPATPLSPGSRFLALKLLGSLQPLYFLVEAKSRVREVYAQTCLHFAKQGMLDTELFGLAVLSGEWRVGPLGFFFLLRETTFQRQRTLTPLPLRLLSS